MSPITNAEGVPMSRLGYGAFKIGRNQNIKYPTQYDLPTEEETATLLNELLEMGITYFDTAPAYGLSEERIGRHLSARRAEFVLSSKVGEHFEAGESRYEFSRDSMLASVERSLERLNTDHLDLLLLHTPANDREILTETEAVPTLEEIRDRGWTRAIGLSGKTVPAAELALDWADALMVEYHANDTSHSEVMQTAQTRGISVLVKKGLAAGHLPPREAIPFVFRHPAVSSLVVGGLNMNHMRTNQSLVPSEDPTDSPK